MALLQLCKALLDVLLREVLIVHLLGAQKQASHRTGDAGPRPPGASPAKSPMAVWQAQQQIPWWRSTDTQTATREPRLLEGALTRSKPPSRHWPCHRRNRQVTTMTHWALLASWVTSHCGPHQSTLALWLHAPIESSVMRMTRGTRPRKACAERALPFQDGRPAPPELMRETANQINAKQETNAKLLMAFDPLLFAWGTVQTRLACGRWHPNYQRGMGRAGGRELAVKQLQVKTASETKGS